MIRVISIVLAALLLVSATLTAEEGRLLRFPDVHKDHVAFVYAGDIYLAPRVGGSAIKLTDHEGQEWFPKFSPDGSRIAFTGQYDGDMAVYTMPVPGGEPHVSGRKISFWAGTRTATASCSAPAGRPMTGGTAGPISSILTVACPSPCQ